ncbi:unnamed protein product [Paramecium primaurelia]|uniref:Uncharacterized protein n=1 Tax=Paramecium primaurelia TaxID=5886 RepID=A0A8S1MER0_PARPR|nr:unnamed protein product [Paramecium primaurelia]
MKLIQLIPKIETERFAQSDSRILAIGPPLLTLSIYQIKAKFKNVSMSFFFKD